MGNYRFMMPNCWLHKLKNMANRSKNNREQVMKNSMKKKDSIDTQRAIPPSPTNRPSYYITSQDRAEEKLPPLALNPIITKPRRKKNNETELEDTRNAKKHSPLVNSPRLVRKKVQVLSKGKQRKERFKESIAVVKSSANPHKDFRESMVEMILENNLLASKDLEDLLACYLSLNSSEYHDLIVQVFEEIWIALSEIILY